MKYLLCNKVKKLLPDLTYSVEWSPVDETVCDMVAHTMTFGLNHTELEILQYEQDIAIPQMVMILNDYLGADLFTSVML